MSKYVDPTGKYILIPVHIEDSDNESRCVMGSELIDKLGESQFQALLDNGKSFVYKGREYFVDEAL